MAERRADHRPPVGAVGLAAVRTEVVDLLATAVLQLLVTGWNRPGPASAPVLDPLPAPPEVPHARP